MLVLSGFLFHDKWQLLMKYQITKNVAPSNDTPQRRFHDSKPSNSEYLNVLFTYTQNQSGHLAITFFNHFEIGM